MSDLSTLHQRLSQLVQDPPVMSGSARILVRDGETDLRAAMQAEISETHLPRRVTFQNGSDDTLVFEVVAGRVLRRPDDLSLLQSRVDAFVKNPTVLRVETERLDPGAAALEAGIALDDLFSASVASDPVAALVPLTDVVAAFLEAGRALCTAGLALSEGASTLAFGADAQLAKLYRLAEVEKDGQVAPTGRGSVADYPSQCVVYAGHPLAGCTVVCVSHARSLGFAILSQDALGPVLDLWKTHIATVNCNAP